MIARTLDELIEHFFEYSMIDYETGCFLWQGARAGRGYGVTSWQSKQVYVHRMAYHFEHPNEVLNVIRHTCDIPNCWRVSHLVNGTTLENIQDKVAKGRQPRGSSMHNARFTEAQILEIRASPLNLYEIAKVYNTNPSTIHYIRVRKTWKHIPEPQQKSSVISYPSPLLRRII